MLSRLVPVSLITAALLAASTFASDGVQTPAPPAPQAAVPTAPLLPASSGHLLSSENYAPGAPSESVPECHPLPCLRSVRTAALPPAPPAMVRPVAIPMALPAQPQSASSPPAPLTPVQHLRRAADHLDAAGDHEDLKSLAVQLRNKAREFEQQAAARLQQLRQQQSQIQREIAMLERIVGENRQIQLNITMLEVSESDLAKVGIDPQHLTGIATSGELQKQQSATTRVIALLHQLQTAGRVRVVAEPSLVTRDGVPATLFSGGEVPILVPQSDGTTTIEWRECGVRLEAVAHVLHNGRLRISLVPEVSERDFRNAITIDGHVVTAMKTRRMSTEVELAFGDTCIFGGLQSVESQGIPDAVHAILVSQAAMTQSLLPNSLVQLASASARQQPATKVLIIIATPQEVLPLR